MTSSTTLVEALAEGAARGAADSFGKWAEVSEKAELAYDDRNALAVAFLATIANHHRMHNVGHYDHGDDGWRVVYANLPTGMVSWHLPAEDVPGWLPPRSPDVYDGHSREEKNRRLSDYVDYIAVGEPDE